MTAEPTEKDFEGMDADALRQAIWDVQTVTAHPVEAAQVIVNQRAIIVNSVAIIRALVRRDGGEARITAEQLAKAGTCEVEPDDGGVRIRTY